MSDTLLKIVAMGSTAAIACLGAILPFFSSAMDRYRRIWCAVFVLLGLISFSFSMWLSDRQDAALEEKLIGGTNYAYLRADFSDLKERRSPTRMWICATGLVFDLKIHPYPFQVSD